MYIYTKNGIIFEETESSNKIEMIQKLLDQENSFNSAKEEMKTVDELTRLDLQNGGKIYSKFTIEKPTENEEIFNYADRGLTINEAEDRIENSWESVPKTLDIAKQNVKEKYFTLRTKQLNEGTYVFPNNQEVIVGDFLLQAVAINKAIEEGAAEVEVRIKDGTYVVVSNTVFKNAYNSVVNDYVYDCNARDAFVDSIESCTNHDDLVVLWEQGKQEIGI